MTQIDSRLRLTRRAALQSLVGAGLSAVAAHGATAAPAGFDQWRNAFRAKASAKGISDATYNGVMGRLEPDMTVFPKLRSQPEFKEQVWQYINRRVSDWRMTAGKVALRDNERLFARIEKDFGVERGTLLALWGVEFRLWRSPRATEPHAARVPAVGGAGLE